jgi:hypothetical protein
MKGVVVMAGTSIIQLAKLTSHLSGKIKRRFFTLKLRFFQICQHAVEYDEDVNFTA